MEIKSILNMLLGSLDRLNDENFDAVMAELNEKMQKISELKLHLKNQYDHSALEKYESGLNNLTKQLSNKFDNIINKVKTEQNAIGLELKNIQNKKKLANYNR